MKRVALFLIFPLATHAGPRDFVRHHRDAIERVALYAAASTATGFAIEKSYDCRRRVGPEPCTEHYGDLKGWSWADGVFTLSMIALSEWGHRDQFKEWWIPAGGDTAFETYWAWRQANTKGAPHEDSAIRPDFSRTVLLHH